MTVQAKETLEALFSDSTGEEYPYTDKFGQAVHTAIQALEEVEQYRALGTPKEIKIREVSSAQLGKAYLSNLTELREYQSLGTVEELKEAREKQVAKKPKFKTTCVNCGTHNSVWGKLANPKGHSVVYCWNCGQANELDWGEEDD